jgi:hypothetical protein
MIPYISVLPETVAQIGKRGNRLPREKSDTKDCKDRERKSKGC